MAIVLGHGKTDWVKNVLAANEADVHFVRADVHIVNPRILPAGGDAEGLPFMARMQAGKWESSSPISRDTLTRWQGKSG